MNETCAEISLFWPLLVFFAGIVTVGVMIARHNDFGLGQTLAALTGSQKFRGSVAIYLTMAATLAGAVALYFVLLPDCAP